MNMTRRAWLGGSIAATSWALGAAGAGAQSPSDFPAKDIKAICNFAPGTRADVMVRFFAERVGSVLNRNVQVASAEMKLPKLLPHIVDQLRWFFAGNGEQIQHQQVQKNSIAFGHMTGKTNTATFLAADQNVLLQHQIPDVFEAYRALVVCQSHTCRDPGND